MKTKNMISSKPRRIVLAVLISVCSLLQSYSQHQQEGKQVFEVYENNSMKFNSFGRILYQGRKWKYRDLALDFE